MERTLKERIAKERIRKLFPKLDARYEIENRQYRRVEDFVNRWGKLVEHWQYIPQRNFQGSLHIWYKVPNLAERKIGYKVASVKENWF